MAEVNSDRLDADTGREWSDAELHELGDMLVRGLSIDEIARRLRRDHGEVRDKVAQIGRACRASARQPWPERVLNLVKSPGGVERIDYAGGCETITIAPGRGQPAQNPSGPLAERAMIGMLSAAYDGSGYPCLDHNPTEPAKEDGSEPYSPDHQPRHRDPKAASWRHYLVRYRREVSEDRGSRG